MPHPGHWPLRANRVAALAAWLAVGHGCTSTLLNPDYCANQGGDAYCRAHGGGFCVHGTNACIELWSGQQAANPDFDGCVEQVPTDMGCYSPCGAGQPATDNDDCEFGTTSGGSSGSTLDATTTLDSTSDDETVDDGSSTSGPSPNCGNGVIDDEETCDGTNLGGAGCDSVGFDGGALACLDDCSGFDTSECSLCGNGIIEGNETCDGDDFGGESCATLVRGQGTLSCTSNCAGFDVNGCLYCGNDIVELDEVCDGLDAGGMTCADAGLGGETLDCARDCSAVGLDACEPPAGYGNCTDFPFADVCVPGEICIANGPDNVCSIPNCLSDMDCPEPAFGDGTVTCLPLGMGINHCILSCNNGEVCPAGMVCTGLYCAWPG